MAIFKSFSNSPPHIKQRSYSLPITSVVTEASANNGATFLSYIRLPCPFPPNGLMNTSKCFGLEAAKPHVTTSITRNRKEEP